MRVVLVASMAAALAACDDGGSSDPPAGGSGGAGGSAGSGGGPGGSGGAGGNAGSGGAGGHAGSGGAGGAGGASGSGGEPMGGAGGMPFVGVGLDLPDGAFACDVLLRDPIGVLGGFRFGVTVEGRADAEPPRHAASFISASPAALADGAVELRVAGDAATLEVAASRCHAADGAPLPGSVRVLSGGAR